MKSSDAKKILSGYWKPFIGSQSLTVFDGKDINERDWTYIILTKKDVEFCLRQLALKVEFESREKEKGK